LFSEIEPVLDTLANRLPPMGSENLCGQVARLKALPEDIQRIEKRLALQLKADLQMQRIA
jgi:hypothetical protein